jgi:hypothetical protein
MSSRYVACNKRPSLSIFIAIQVLLNYSSLFNGRCRCLIEICNSGVPVLFPRCLHGFCMLQTCSICSASLRNRFITKWDIGPHLTKNEAMVRGGLLRKIAIIIIWSVAWTTNPIVIVQKSNDGPIVLLALPIVSVVLLSAKDNMIVSRCCYADVCLRVRCRAVYYCRQCHGDVNDTRVIKKCKCKSGEQRLQFPLQPPNVPLGV